MIIYNIGSEVVIELKSDIEVTGIIEDVDPAMNVILAEAKEVRPNGEITYCESTSIKGTTIRYVHIPPKLRMRAHVTEYIKKVDRIKVHSRPHTIKDRPKHSAEPNEKSDIILS